MRASSSICIVRLTYYHAGAVNHVLLSCGIGRIFIDKTVAGERGVREDERARPALMRGVGLGARPPPTWIAQLVSLRRL